jgi:VCBS repeat-containing protein
MTGLRRLAMGIASMALLGAAPAAAAADFSNAPVLAPIPDQTVAELSQMRVAVEASDPDLPNDVLQFSLAGGPLGPVMSPSGTITWTPSESSGPGTYTIVARVVDSSGQSDQQSFQVTVTEVNTPPQIGFIPDQSLGPGDELQLEVPVTDVDEPANTFTFEATGLPPGTSIDSKTGRISGTVTTDGEASSGTARITVTDSGDPPGQATRSFSWLVTAGNHAPTMQPLGEQTIGDDGAVRFTVVAQDADRGDTLSYWLAEGVDPVPAGATIDANSGVFVWRPAKDEYGTTYRFNVIVSDSGSPRLSDTQLITVVLPEYNSPPEITPVADQHSAEGDTVLVAMAATDIDGNVLTFSASGLPAGLEIDPATGAISGNVGYEAGARSPYNVVVTVSDGGLPPASSHVSFKWVIDETNRPPVVTPVTVAAMVGRTTTVALDVTDPDGDPLTYTIVDRPSNGTLSGVPPVLSYLSDGGTSDAFTFTVSDGEFTVEGTVLIEIRESNAPPEPGVDEYQLTSGETFQVDAPGVLGNDHDPDSERLTAALVARPDHGDLTLNADGSFTYTPEAGYVGADKFTYAAVDELGEKSTATVVLTVVAGATSGEVEPGTGSRATIIAATAATWQRAEVERGGVLPRLGRALTGAFHSGIAAVPTIAYPLLLLIAVLVLALTVGKVSLLPVGNGRMQGEGTVDWYDPARGFGRVLSDSGGEEVFVHAGSFSKGETPVSGQRVEFIAATIRDRMMALKAWRAS